MYKRTHELEAMLNEYENRSDAKLFPSMNDQHAVLVTYDLPCAATEEYASIDQAFLAAFTDKYSKKILATTWLIKRPFGFYSVRSELRFILPPATKSLVAEIVITHLHHSGFDKETLGWIGLQG